jgi:hypothetical protein
MDSLLKQSASPGNHFFRFQIVRKVITGFPDRFHQFKYGNRCFIRDINYLAVRNLQPKVTWFRPQQMNPAMVLHGRFCKKSRYILPLHQFENDNIEQLALVISILTFIALISSRRYLFNQSFDLCFDSLVVHLNFRIGNLSGIRNGLVGTFFQ